MPGINSSSKCLKHKRVQSPGDQMPDKPRPGSERCRKGFPRSMGRALGTQGVGQANGLSQMVLHDVP